MISSKVISKIKSIPWKRSLQPPLQLCVPWFWFHRGIWCPDQLVLRHLTNIQYMIDIWNKDQHYFLWCKMFISYYLPLRLRSTSNSSKSRWPWSWPRNRHDAGPLFFFPVFLAWEDGDRSRVRGQQAPPVALFLFFLFEDIL